MGELAKKPELQAKLQAGNKQAVVTWAAAVRMGSMSRDEFEETVQLEVDTGRMDAADAEAARQSLDH